MKVKMLLSIQRALLGCITPELRAVTASFKKKLLHIIFYYDGEISSNNREIAEEIIGEIESVGSKSKKVDAIYQQLIKKGNNEFNILLNIEIEELKRIGGQVLAEAIKRMRAGQVHLQSGYDGQYGVVKVFTEQEIKKLRGEQKSLF